MATVYDVRADILIEEAAKDLTKLENIKAPDWAAYVKTGTAKERPPARNDWWMIRAASIMRAVYKSKGPIGVQKLRIKYGSKKNRGHKPERFYKASGKVIRLIIQQLEKEELVKQAEKGVHKGRMITPKGKSFMDKIASRLVSKKPKKTSKKPQDKTDKPKQETKEKSQDQTDKPEPKQETSEQKEEPDKESDEKKGESKAEKALPENG